MDSYEAGIEAARDKVKMLGQYGLQHFTLSEIADDAVEAFLGEVGNVYKAPYPLPHEDLVYASKDSERDEAIFNWLVPLRPTKEGT